MNASTPKSFYTETSNLTTLPWAYIKIKKVQLITLGDHKVGKTSILKRYSFNKFSFETYPTIGVDFVSKKIDIGTQPVIVKIWDTAGQDRFHTITHSFYKQCQGVLLVFDVGSRETFESLNTWIENIQSNVEEDTAKYLLGNKVDTEIRQVTEDEGKKVASKYGMKYFEVSAKSGNNVDVAINSLAEDVYKRLKSDKRKGKTRLSKKEKKGNSRCC